jgi:ribosome biogenesis protein BRX1
MKRQRAPSAPAAAAAPAAPASGAAAAATAAATAASASGRLPAVVSYTNKHRCLVFGSRGMTARYRHLLEDVRALVPHHKKESKVRC